MVPKSLSATMALLAATSAPARAACPHAARAGAGWQPHKIELADLTNDATFNAHKFSGS